MADAQGESAATSGTPDLVTSASTAAFEVGKFLWSAGETVKEATDSALDFAGDALNHAGDALDAVGHVAEVALEVTVEGAKMLGSVLMDGLLEG